MTVHKSKATGRYEVTGRKIGEKWGAGIPDLSLAPKERRDYGPVVTAVRVDAAAPPRTIAGSGTAIEGLRECVQQIDSWDGDWRIQTVSTVTTIHRDLHGSREKLETQVKDRRDQAAHLPERLYLGKIGRIDLLLPGASADRRQRAPEPRSGEERTQ